MAKDDVCFRCPLPDCDDTSPRCLVRQAMQANQRAYYEANREKVAANKRAYREANREKVAANQRAYREANREKVAANKRPSPRCRLHGRG